MRLNWGKKLFISSNFNYNNSLRYSSITNAFFIIFNRRENYSISNFNPFILIKKSYKSENFFKYHELQLYKNIKIYFQENDKK